MSLKLALPFALILSGCLSGGGESNVADSDTPPIDDTNSAPSISGNPPATVKIGESYSFTPNASDPDGDSLTFAIENKPSWADFNTGSGQISGTPTLGNVGTFVNIQISVSDDMESAGLPPFSIDVTQVGTVSTTLQWTAPTQNEDGTTLTDLAGYKIYYGNSSGNYSSTIRIDNPSVTTYLVENLTPDTYYFAATAFNVSGVESRHSGEAIKVLD